MPTKIKEQEREIPCGRGNLSGILHVPPQAEGVAVFAHGSGSGRFSPRNQYVAEVLQQGGLATLLIDLLLEEEADDREKVFDMWPIYSSRTEAMEAIVTVEKA